MGGFKKWMNLPERLNLDKKSTQTVQILHQRNRRSETARHYKRKLLRLSSVTKRVILIDSVLQRKLTIHID